MQARVYHTGRGWARETFKVGTVRFAGTARFAQAAARFAQLRREKRKPGFYLSATSSKTGSGLLRPLTRVSPIGRTNASSRMRW